MGRAREGILRLNLALFDFDGTITIKDTFVPFVRFAMRPRRMPIATARFLPVGANTKFYRWTEIA